MTSLVNFTFVGLPFRGDTDLQRASQFQRLQNELGLLGPVLRSVMIPQLKVGTLDSLVEASDDLARLDPSLETTVFRLASLIEDITQGSRSQATMLNLTAQSQKVSAEYYLKEFESFGWNSAQFDTKDGITALVQKFQQVLSSSEERSRGILNEYNEAKTKLHNFIRRAQGNLSSIPIKELVDQWCVRQGLQAPTETEFLTTLFVAVPLNEQQTFQNEYAHFHDYVVPRSSSLVAADSDFALYSIVCFKKVVDDVKAKCRAHRFAVRDVATVDDMTPDAVFKLKEKVAHDKERLSVILSQQYTQCFTAWVHLKCVRLFVESVLKFGVPVRFVPAIMATDAQKEEQVLAALGRIYADHTPLASVSTSIGEEAAAARNAKLALMSGTSETLQADGSFVILKCSNVLKSR